MAITFPDNQMIKDDYLFSFKDCVSKEYYYDMGSVISTIMCTDLTDIFSSHDTIILVNHPLFVKDVP